MITSKSSIIDRLSRFVQRVFRTTLDVFFEALKLSPNAQGYVSGSITELLLKRKMEQEYGLEVLRIREKWEGKKHRNHHGDFYFRKRNSRCWYVMESKGVKSNSEKWHRLYNRGNLKNFMITHADNIPWINSRENVETQVTQWIENNLPRFQGEYASNLYEYDEVQKYKPKRDTEKARAIAILRQYSREQINQMIDDRLAYIMSRVRVLETHFVSGTSESSERTQATPRKDEFNIVAVDIVLRYHEHKFVFANPQNLESSSEDSDHLQQNYIMGFVFPAETGTGNLSIAEDWYHDLREILETLTSDDCVAEKDMQVDRRYEITQEED
jgi:hypothetical protein